MEHYCVKTEKDSLITNDPNDWSDDPRYILDLVKRIMTVSLETMKIVNALPTLNERKFKMGWDIQRLHLRITFSKIYSF